MSFKSQIPTYLNIHEPMQNLTDAPLSIRNPPYNKIEASFRKEVLMCGIIFPLTSKIPSPERK
jgi:hypothetical protein